MRDINEIDIKKAVVHVLDLSLDSPLLNGYEINLDGEIGDYLTKHIQRVISDDNSFSAMISDEDNFIKNQAVNLQNNTNNFLEVSRNIADYIFKEIKQDIENDSGDVIECLFNSELGEIFAIMKFNYNKTYIHGINYKDDKLLIDIIPQFIGLPSPGQRVNFCILINLANPVEVLIFDKNIKNYGDGRGSYLTNEILKCSIQEDNRNMTREFLNSSEKFIRKNVKDNAVEAEKARSTIKKMALEEDVLNINKVADEAFKEDNELKNMYMNEFTKDGVDNYEINIDRGWIDKKLKRRKLKIDKDIELYIDSESYENSNKFEIKRNGDGTINIILKGIRNYIEK